MVETAKEAQPSVSAAGTSAAQSAVIPAADEKPPKGSRYYPLAIPEYVGLILLFCIPFAGWAVLLCFAMGASKNINRTRFARAWLIISLLLGGLAVASGLLIDFIVKSAVDVIVSSVTSSVIETTAEQTGVELDVIGDTVNDYIMSLLNQAEETQTEPPAEETQTEPPAESAQTGESAEDTVPDDTLTEP